MVERQPPMGWWRPSPSLTSTVSSLLIFVSAFFLCLFFWPARLHAPQCLCLSLAVWTTPAFLYPARAFTWAARAPASRTVQSLQVSDKMAPHNEPEWTESIVCVRVSSYQLIAPALARSRKPQWPYCVFLFPSVCFNANSLVLRLVFGSRSAWFWFTGSRSALVCRCARFLLFLMVVYWYLCRAVV